MTATGQWLSVSREISIQIYQGQTQVKGYESHWKLVSTYNKNSHIKMAINLNGHLCPLINKESIASMANSFQEISVHL